MIKENRNEVIIAARVLNLCLKLSPKVPEVFFSEFICKYGKSQSDHFGL